MFNYSSHPVIRENGVDVLEIKHILLNNFLKDTAIAAACYSS